jgi:hypothetical protein
MKRTKIAATATNELADERRARETVEGCAVAEVRG